MKYFYRLAVIVGSLPVTLTNGTTADATQVMSDLNWLVNQVNANAAPLSTTALTNVNNNFTTVQSGTAAAAAANFPIASQVQNGSFNTLSSTLGTNVLTARISSLPLAAYAVGQVFTFVPSQKNTGSTTIAIDGLGSMVIQSSGQQLVGQELGSGTAIIAVSSITPGQPVADILNSQRQTIPPGVIWDFGGLNAPSGWLVCDGSARSRSAFAALFAAIGSNFGSTADAASFNIPDFRRRVSVGAGGTGTATLANTVGSSGGEENHTLTTGELPAATYGITPGLFGATGGPGPGKLQDSNLTGSGTAHNVMQPSLVVNKIVKT